MKKKPISKRKPAAIVVGRNKDWTVSVSSGEEGVMTRHGVIFAAEAYESHQVDADLVVHMGLSKLKPGQYIRFVQDGGVRKARRVK